MKNQKVILLTLGIGLIALIGGGYFVLSSNKNSKPLPAPQPQTSAEKTVLTLSPEDIGLTLTAIENNRKVVIKIDKPLGIGTIEYELSWGAKVKDVSSGDLLDVVRGTESGGAIEMNGKPYKNEIVLGTCSDVCHYDIGVNNIKIILKITKTDGKLYKSEKTLAL